MLDHLLHNLEQVAVTKWNKPGSAAAFAVQVFLGQFIVQISYLSNIKQLGSTMAKFLNQPSAGIPQAAINVNNVVIEKRLTPGFKDDFQPFSSCRQLGPPEFGSLT